MLAHSLTLAHGSIVSDVGTGPNMCDDDTRFPAQQQEPPGLTGEMDPGQPAEVAPAFVFLASPAEASHVSGTVLGVTGGRPVF